VVSKINTKLHFVELNNQIMHQPYSTVIASMKCMKGNYVSENNLTITG